MTDNGREYGIRTHDLFVPNEARYQTALIPVLFSMCYYSKFILKKSTESQYSLHNFLKSFGQIRNMAIAVMTHEIGKQR